MTRTGARARIEELRQEIRRHEHLYYVAAKPEIRNVEGRAFALLAFGPDFATVRFNQVACN